MIVQKTEVVVVGGGMVGSALALGLAMQGLKITVVELTSPPAFIASAWPEVRISALNVASIALLSKLGIWDTVCSMRVHPYRRLEIWEWENARVTFDARELNLSKLGCMVENNVLRQALWQAIKNHPNVTLYVPASLTSLYSDGQKYHLTLNDGNELVATLVVGADGTNSQVRQLANIGIHSWQYRQLSMLIIVQCENDPGDNAWQHFTPSGPHAFLPLFDHWAALVWYDIPTRIHELQGLTMSQLEHEVSRHFPRRLGKVTPVAVGVFPLMHCHALQYVRKGLALVGDAAHTIHPLAGQGVNLGYRDVNVLLEVINYASTHGESWASQAVLSRYQHRRMVDNFVMQLGIDLFYVGFSNNLAPICLLRNIGLTTIQHAKYLKCQLLKYALGLL